MTLIQAGLFQLRRKGLDLLTQRLWISLGWFGAPAGAPPKKAEDECYHWKWYEHTDSKVQVDIHHHGNSMSCGFAMKMSTIKINVHNLIENKYVISLDDSSVNPCPPVPGAWKNSPSISHITHDTDSAIKKAVKNRSNYIMDLLINYIFFNC